MDSNITFTDGPYETEFYDHRRGELYSMEKVFDEDFMSVESAFGITRVLSDLGDRLQRFIMQQHISVYFDGFFQNRLYGSVSWTDISVTQIPALSLYTEPTLRDVADNGEVDFFAVNAVNNKCLPLTQDIAVSADCWEIGLYAFYARLYYKGVPLMVHAEYDKWLRGTRFVTVYYGESDVDKAKELLAVFKELAKTRSIYKNKAITIARDGRSIEFVKSREGKKGDDVLLTDQQRDLLNRYIIWPLTHPDECRRLGLQVGRGVLLEGPPGTGKTMTSHWLMDQLNGKVTFLLATGRMIAEEGANSVAHLFDIAADLAPSLIWFEDLDLFGSRRSGGYVSPSILAELLTRLDGVQDRGSVSIVATTNMVETLDEALARRPYRFDIKISYPLPQEDMREKLLRLFAREKIEQGIINDIPKSMVARTHGLSGAYLKELVDSAVLRAMERGASRVEEADFEAVLPQIVEENRRQLGFLSD